MTDHHPTVAELTETAAEAIRAANHLIISPGETTVPDVYRVLGELAALSRRLPQLYDQLARNLRHREATGDLRLDAHGERRSHGDAHEAIAEADTALQQAAGLTPEITRLLDQAQAAIAFVADYGGDV